MSGLACMWPQAALRPAAPCEPIRVVRGAGKQVRREFLRRVHAGEVQYARKLTHSRTMIVLRYGGEEVAFIYSNQTKRIVCYLPPGAPETAWPAGEAP